MLPPRTFLVILFLIASIGSSKGLAIEHENIYQTLAEARATARTGNYPEALDKLQEAMSLAQESGEELALAITLENMAEIHRLQGNPREALDHYSKALKIYQDIGHSMGISFTGKKVNKILGRTRLKDAPPKKKAPETASAEIPAETREKLINSAIDRIRNRVKEQQAKEGTSEHPLPEASGTTASLPTDPFLPPSGTQETPDDTRQLEYTTYLEKVKGNIVRAWKYPVEASEGKEEGKVDVEFTILKNGRLQNVRILRSSGFSSLDREAIRAVGAASPFYPIPKQIGLDQLSIRFTFNYTLEMAQGSK